ncbi:MAG: hypothetical protein WEB06_11025 [Actinomycetota bacterium]
MESTTRDIEGGETSAMERPEVESARPNGPAVAALVAAAFGSFVLGLFTTLAEVSEPLKNWLNWSNPVGPLSGKTGLALAAWVGAWLALGVAWRRSEVDLPKALIASAALIGLGVLGTFPSFFEQFAVG